MSESYFWGILTGVSLAPFYRFLMLGFEEAVVKPLAIKFMRRGLRKYVQPALDVLDEKIRLPENWETFIDQKAEWVRNAVLPEVSDRFSDEELEKLYSLVIAEFDMDVFLSKMNNRN